MPIVLLTSLHISLFGNGACCVPQRTFSSISVVLPHGRVDPNLSTQSSALCYNQCHGGERRKYVKTQRKKTRLKGSHARQWGRNENSYHSCCLLWGRLFFWYKGYPHLLTDVWP
ncbi:hypothetical protein BX666DRAFT_1992238, partial [Dichotomocladium elegans]